MAGAVEEISSTTASVAEDTKRANQIAKNASDLGADARTKMKSLQEIIQRITSIVDTLKDIADQTNLLALNATIEAATAGEAGKGFSVVANEVKELARQSSEEAGGIGDQVDAMLNEAKEVSEAIIKMNTVLDEVHGLNTAIASAMGEQSTTVGDISQTLAGMARSASSISERSLKISTDVQEMASSATNASSTVDDVAKHIDEGANAATEIAAAVTKISTASQETLKSASASHDSAEDLSKQAQMLTHIASRFKV